MRKLIALGAGAVYLVMAANMPAWAGWDPNAIEKARDTVSAFKRGDPGLEVFFNQAYGYAVFPSIAKGAIGIGGAYGTGTVFEQGAVVGKSTVTKVSIGLQLGGQSYREIIFFKDKQTFDDFKEGKFELDAEASAVAVKQGASGAADFDQGVAVFTMTTAGLMFEASVGGQKFSFESN